MKSVKVNIEGVSPLLMNRRPLDIEDISGNKVKRKGETIDPVKDAEKKAWFDKKAGYYIPSEMIEASIREASKDFKKGRGTMKNTVLSSIVVSSESGDEKCLLNTKSYDDIDHRWGTHPSTRNSVLTSRVKFNKGWKTTFTIEYDENKLDDNQVKALLEEAGCSKGIGSYRPKFGRFKIVSFCEQRQASFKG